MKPNILVLCTGNSCRSQLLHGYIQQLLGDRAVTTDLAARGLDVLLDDRTGKISPGVKFKDAELIGVPTIITVGRGLADGTVEVRDRRTDAREEVAVGDAAAHVAELVRA